VLALYVNKESREGLEEGMEIAVDLLRVFRVRDKFLVSRFIFIHKVS
jgi:hypothetical protein